MPVADDRRSTTFSLLVVPGVTVDRWSRMWSERVPGVHLSLVPAEPGTPRSGQADPLRSAGADAGLVRMPVDHDTFHAIPLYTEVTVVVVPRDHLFAAADEVTIADLADETLVRPLDDVLDWTGTPVAPATGPANRPPTTAAAVELVAAGGGVLVVPQSLARVHHRRDLTYRVVSDAPTSSVALVWVRDRHTDLVEEMIGIVRGRTANSTRGRSAESSSGGPNPRTSPRRRGR